MHTTRWLAALRRHPLLPAAQNGPLLGRFLQPPQQQPMAVKPAAAAAAVTFVRNFRVKPRRNKNLPPRKTPFKGHMEQMNYACFQLAMDVIRKDRTEIAEKIKVERERIEKVKRLIKENPENEKEYQISLADMKQTLEKLLIMHDINSPRVRYNYLKKTGSMEKPVHRFLAQKDFASMRQKILKQRIDTMFLVPDVIPYMEPLADVRLKFRSSEVDPGEFVRSRMSQTPPSVKVIPYEKKDRLCTIAVVDPDVPDIERDTYTYRLHWLVSNIEINHVQTQAIGLGSKGATTLSPYLPPYVHRGAPYHRYCLMVFDQDKGRIEKSETEIERDGFNMRSFMAKNNLSPLSAFIWRGKWDKYTKRLMQDNNIEGWNLRFVRRNH